MHDTTPAAHHSLRVAIQNLRQKMGLSQIAFAPVLGKSYGILQRYEQITPPTGRETLAKLALLARDHAPELFDVFHAAYAAQISPDERAFLDLTQGATHAPAA